MPLLFSSCSSDERSETSLPMELNFTGRILSCSDFLVNQLLDSENSNISLSINGTGRENLNLTSEYKSFSLPNNDLIASISVWDNSIGGNLCNDVIVESPNLVSSWNAVSGNLKLSVSNIEETEYETYYTITILLEDVLFEDPESGDQRMIPNLIIENAPAGWLPG